MSQIWRKRIRKRGTRGFKRSARPIEVRVADRTTSQVSQPLSVNLSALRQIQPHDPNKLNIHIWNARSICNKTTVAYDYTLEQDVDILVLTETWLKGDDHVIIGEITPAGYDFINVPRSTGRRGGGIGVLYKSSLQLSVVPSDTTPTTFEHVRVVGKLKDICLTAIYRPPPSQANVFTTRNFLDELEIFYR